MLQAYIDNRMRYGLALAEENQLLKGSGVGNNLNGLYTQATSFGASGNKIDVLRKAVVELEVNEYQPNGIVLNPRDWQELTSLKSTTGEYLFGAPMLRSSGGCGTFPWS